MNTRQIELVQQTFEQAAPYASQIADLFYRRLFELDPSLRLLFHGDLNEQGAKLMTVLAFAVRGLHQPNTILDAVRRLGERHIGYGVEADHYTTVGEALLWTLAESFGSEFTSEVREAWAQAYQTLAGVMQRAGEEQLYVLAN